MANPDKPANRPTVDHVLPLAKGIYATAHGGVGGCLHILLDDGNCEQSDADFCLTLARERDCGICRPVAELIHQMTDTQRRKLYRLVHQE